MVRKKRASLRQRQMTGNASDRKQSEKEGRVVKKRGVRRRALQTNSSRAVVEEAELLATMTRMSYSPGGQLIIF